jgi:anti-sigma factor ChrR (cupin superfamily)
MRRLWRWRQPTEKTASCREVTKVLQSFLDGQTDEVTTYRVALHLEACRQCGLEAATYRQIKLALGHQAPQVDPATLERLRAFAGTLADRT